MKVDKLGLLRKEKLSKCQNVLTFGHKMFISSQLTGASNQKTYLTKVVKEYAPMQAMPCKSLNMVSFWSQNVHFVTTLLVPLIKKLI